MVMARSMEYLSEQFDFSQIVVMKKQSKKDHLNRLRNGMNNLKFIFNLIVILIVLFSISLLMIPAIGIAIGVLSKALL